MHANRWHRWSLRAVFLICMVSVTSHSFQHYYQAVRHAQRTPEYPPIDNDDWFNPDYTTFHDAHKPSFLAYFADKWRLYSPDWSIRYFKQQVASLVSRRRSEGFSGRFMQTIRPAPGAQLYIWTDLQGAFHSLVRTLGFLMKKGIIDEELRIVGPDRYFIFNGSEIDRSAHTMETLSLIMQLMEKNPHTVFYIRGRHEDKQYWHNHALKRELQTRSYYFSQEMVPLDAMVTDFFDTLPLILYVVGKEDDNAIEAVRIAHYDRHHHELLNNDTLAVGNTRKKLWVKALLQGEDRRVTFTSTRGLEKLIPQRDVIAWTQLSAPTSTYQRLYDFYYDAFVRIDITAAMDDWTITLYNQDVRTMQGIAPEATYYLLSGNDITKESEKRHRNPPYVFGSTLDLTRGTKVLGNRVLAGLYQYIDYINHHDGLFERSVRLNCVDDAYEPSKARKNIDYFLRNGITNILSPTNSPTTRSYLDVIEEGKVLVLFPVTGAPDFRQKDLSHIINFRPSYTLEGYVLTKYALEEFRANTIAFFYQDDVFGLGALHGARLALSEKSKKSIIEIPYLRNDTSFAGQAKKIVEFDPDVVCFFSTSVAARQLILQVGIDNLAETKIAGLSDLGISTFKHFVKRKGLSYAISNVVPNPLTSDLAIVKEFRKNNLGAPLDVFSLEGYINASLCFELLRLSGGDDNAQALIAQAEQMKKTSFKGLELDFDPATRQLSHTLWLDVGEDEWVKRVVAEPDLSTIPRD